MKATTFAILYGLVAIVHLIGELLPVIGLEEMLIIRFVTKPALMVLLFIYGMLLVGKNKDGVAKLILTSLAFSWSGDVNLMMPSVPGYSSYEEQFFLLGLVSFLIAHVLYILAFRKEINRVEGPSLLKRKPYAALPVVIGLGALLVVVFPEVNAEMKIPVMVYATIISVMTIFAVNRYGKVNDSSYKLVLAGAVLFMISDSMIAINKFHTEFDWSRVAIMFTYITAQYLIVKGSLTSAKG